MTEANEKVINLPPKCNPRLARRHIELLTGSPDRIVNIRLIGKESAWNLSGRLADLWETIEKQQATGYGVYVVVNEGGHNSKSITRIRALFIDGDGIPLPEHWHCKPSFLVIRDATHWHAYWLIDDLPVELFTAFQKRLIAHYGTDPAVHDLPRVMRLAGSLHLKGEPVLMTLEAPEDAEQWELMRTIEDVEHGLDVMTSAERKEASPAAGEPVTETELLARLAVLDPGVKYPQWYRTIAGIRATPLPDDPSEEKRRDIARRWSRGELHGIQPELYTGDKAVDAAFDTLPPMEGGIGFGSLDYDARKAGYTGLPGSKVFPHIAEQMAASEAATDADDTEDEDRRTKYRGIKPSEGAKRPKATFWDKAQTLPRYPRGSRIFAMAHPGQHKTNLVGAKCVDAILEHGARVVFCAGEDADEFLTERLPALCAAKGIPVESLDGRILVSEMCPQLTDPGEVDAFIAEYREFKPDFVVMDTYSEAIPGKNESAPDVGNTAMHQAGRIRRAFHATVILIHHLGKDPTKGLRGWSGYEAAANAVWEISFDRERGIVKQWVAKLKRGRAKFAVWWGTQIFGETMTVVPLNGVDAGRVFGGEDDTYAVEVLGMLRKARDKLPADMRTLAEWMVGPTVTGEARERELKAERKRLERGVRRGDKPGPLAHLVELDRRGEPLKPYRFYIPEIYEDE